MVVAGEIIPSSAAVCCDLMVCTAALAGFGHQCPWSWSQLSQRVRISVCQCEHPRFELLCSFSFVFSMTQRDSKEEAGGAGGAVEVPLSVSVLVPHQQQV